MRSNKRKPPILKVLLEKKQYIVFHCTICGLDRHIPGNVTRNEINTELEHFYQSIVGDVFDLRQHNIDRIKIKLRSVCEKYHNLKLPYKHRDKQLILEQKNRYVIARQR